VIVCAKLSLNLKKIREFLASETVDGRPPELHSFKTKLIVAFVVVFVCFILTVVHGFGCIDCLKRLHALRPIDYHHTSLPT